MDLNTKLKEAYEYEGDYDRPLGPHMCKIIDISEYETKEGSKALKLVFDICEGEYENYFSKFADNLLGKWPYEGIRYLSLNRNCLSYLKEFFESIESCNNMKLNINENFDLDSLKGLKFKGEFGYKEDSFNGDTNLKLCLHRFRNKDYEISPAKIYVKCLDGEMIEYITYKAIQETGIEI